MREQKDEAKNAKGKDGGHNPTGPNGPAPLGTEGQNIQCNRTAQKSTPTVNRNHRPSHGWSTKKWCERQANVHRNPSNKRKKLRPLKYTWCQDARHDVENDTCDSERNQRFDGEWHGV